MGWQPIKTAPRDGTPVLLFYPEGIWDSAWNDYEGRFLPDMAVMRWDGEDRPVSYAHCWRGYYDGTNPRGNPTLWKAIAFPELPQTKE